VNAVRSWFERLFTEEPVLASYLINGGLAALLTFILHLSSTQSAAVTTVTLALVTVYNGFRTTPPKVSVITGGMTTLLTACAAFGLHLPTNTVGALVTVVSAVIPLLLRTHVSPN
jgi:hypothetical protein